MTCNMNWYEIDEFLQKCYLTQVFIAGRNRLEKEGAKAYAGFFEAVGTLEEVAMPQNGIFHEGIAALAKALATNKNIRIINLNDK